MPQISFFENTTNTIPHKNPFEISLILEKIKDGHWEKKIMRLRNMPIEEYKEAKRDLPAVTFSGTFTERQAENIVSYSKVLIIDVDHVLLSQINAYKKEFPTDPYIYAAFVSPSNEGLKILVKVDSEKESHLDAFLGIKKYLEDKYAMSVDRTGKDICRLCYVSFDPELYLNDNSVEWHTEVSTPSNTPVLDGTKWKDAKFIGRKVSSDVQYIFNVAKKWTERTFQCVPGSYNNYVHYLSCIMNRCGVVISDTMLLVDTNFILPDRKWVQSVRSAYFHNKTEHNTVPVFELEKNGGGIVQEEKSFSENEVENDIIRMAVTLLNKNIDHKEVKKMMDNYVYKLVHEGFIELDEVGLKKLLAQAWNNSDQALISTNSLMFKSTDDMLGDCMDSARSATITTGLKEFDEALGGGMSQGSFYGLIGQGGTFKSIFAQYLAAENAKTDVPVLYLNMEMANKQYYSRLFNKELKIDFDEEKNSGKLTKETSQQYSDRLTSILKNNLFTVTSTNVSKEQILSTIANIKTKTGKEIKLIIVDGITQMYDAQNNEILSTITNSGIAKDIAKEANVAVLGLMHVSGGIGKYQRDTSKNVRGGQKVIANMDSYFCTSLIIDPATLDNPNDDVMYESDKLYLRIVDKRGSGEIFSKIVQISRPLNLEVLAYNPTEKEIEMSK